MYNNLMKRKDFLMLNEYTYLDSAASCLKPSQVVNKISEYYHHYSINPHSFDSKVGMIVKNKIEETRKLIANLVDCETNEVIFTSGTTQSLNLVMHMLSSLVKHKDKIIVSPYNHASNYIPWFELSKKKNLKFIESENIYKDIENAKIIALAQQNNTLDEHYDIEKIYKEVKANKGYLINDAAQAIAHQKVSLNNSDIIAFSGNKLYGPTGVGVLIIKSNLLRKMRPTTFGGGSNLKFNKIKWEPQKMNIGHESGTLNVAGIIGLGEAIKYFDKNKDWSLEEKVSSYAYDKLSSIKKIDIYSKRGDNIILFNIKGIHAQDVVSYLGYKNIILRGGMHCAKAVCRMKHHAVSIRISIAGYNRKEDIDLLVDALLEEEHFIQI